MASLPVGWSRALSRPTTPSPAATRHRDGRMGIDATWKPGYPKPLEMPEEIVPRRDERCRECGL